MLKRWTFDAGRSGFAYEDDVFQFTDAGRYARGEVASGQLDVVLGGRDDAVVEKMSGGWSKSFRLDEAMEVTLTFKVKLAMGSGTTRKDFADVRVALDGEQVSFGGKNHALRLKGLGEDQRHHTGWQTIEVDLGLLPAGRHEFTLGGYMNRKAGAGAFAKLQFDDVRVEGAAPAPPKLAKFERQVLKLTNAFRADNGLGPLKVDGNLVAAAEDWSRAMAKGDFFEHSDKPRQFEKFGYEADGWGENIAAGYPNPSEVVQGWIDSPGHRANLLRADFEHIGIGYYRLKGDGGAAPYEHYWTQIFGVPADDYLG